MTENLLTQKPLIYILWESNLIQSLKKTMHPKAIHHYRLMGQQLKSYFYLVTCQTRMRLSVQPENKVWPSGDQVREIHSGSELFLPTPTKSTVSSSTFS